MIDLTLGDVFQLSDDELIARLREVQTGWGPKLLLEELIRRAKRADDRACRAEAQYEALRSEYHEMRTNPLYGAYGQYWFECNGHTFGLSMQAGKVLEFFEMDRGSKYLGMAVPEPRTSKS